MKYIMMGTSSNFGNMFSTAGAATPGGTTSRAVTLTAVVIPEGVNPF